MDEESLPQIILECSEALSPFLGEDTPTQQKEARRARVEALVQMEQKHLHPDRDITIETHEFTQLLPALKTFRKEFFEISGVELPPIELYRDCTYLAPGQCLLKIGKEIEYSWQIGASDDPEAAPLTETERSELCLLNEHPKRLQSMQIKARPTTNPVNGLVASWINTRYQPILKQMGYTVWNIPQSILLFLSHVLGEHAPLFLTPQVVSGYIENLRDSFPSLVNEVTPSKISINTITQVLRRLVEEKVSICYLMGILETLSEWAHLEDNPHTLTEYVRMDMKTQLTKKAALRNQLVVYLLVDEWEAAIRGAMGTGSIESLAPQLHSALDVALGQLPTTAQQPVLCTAPDIRRQVFELIRDAFPFVVVLSFRELDPEVQVMPIDQIRWTL